MATHHTPAQDPAIFVIFGITGDLAQRYLLPSLYHLFQEELLHPNTKIVGLSRQDLTVDELFGKVELCINEVDNKCDPVALKAMRTATEMLQFDPAEGGDYHHLKQRLDEIEASVGDCMDRLFYLSIPPQVFSETIKYLGNADLQTGCVHGEGQSRILIEKPFGHDLASGEALIKETAGVYEESQIYRIDHYLAKETVQNILTFRSQNPIFGSIWNHRRITAIDINASEKIGIEGRANFYEGVGALRDLIQSHLMQLMAVTMMELPPHLDKSEVIHRHKYQLLKSVLPADPKLAHRGQYDNYRQEVNNEFSSTETFASITLQLDDPQWLGVPVTIRTGKALADRHTEVNVTFNDPHDDSDVYNVLTFRIQPQEGIHIGLRVKRPGYDDVVQEASMDFDYQSTFGDSEHPSAYERVLFDAVRGDRTLFASSDEVLESWRIIEPVIKAWHHNHDGLSYYASGTDILAADV